LGGYNVTQDLQRKLEAVLFAAGRTVSLVELGTLCSTPVDPINQALRELKKELDERNSALTLLQEGEGWKLTVREGYLELVKSIVPHTELDRALLQTLAVIAWKQPVLQADIIKIRTSAAYEHIKLLEDMGFVSKEKHGRSYILKTTGRFFDYFDLPEKKGSLKEVFKGIAVKEGKPIPVELGELEVYEEDDLKEKPVGELDVYEGAKPVGEGEEEFMPRSDDEPNEEETQRIIDDLAGGTGQGDTEEEVSEKEPKLEEAESEQEGGFEQEEKEEPVEAEFTEESKSEKEQGEKEGGEEKKEEKEKKKAKKPKLSKPSIVLGKAKVPDEEETTLDNRFEE
jgi:segregation and condensation protein B